MKIFEKIKLLLFKIISPLFIIVIAVLTSYVIVNTIETYSGSTEGIVVAKTHYEAYDDIIYKEREHKTNSYTYTETSPVYEHHPDKYELLMQFYDPDDEKYRYYELYVDEKDYTSIPVGQKLVFDAYKNKIIKKLEVIDINYSVNDNNCRI